jgi:glycosyltransferase involved in cell wall biosynthesis
MLLKLFNASALSGFEQRVVALLPGGSMVEVIRAAGGRVDELDFLGGLPLLTGASGLIRVGRRWDPDLIHGWLYHGNLGAALVRATLRRRVPLLWGIRQSLATMKGENIFARTAIVLNKAWSGYPDRLLFNSRVSEAQHLARGFAVERALCIPNGFDVAGVAPDATARAHWRSIWNVDDEAVVFGLLARYHPVKDHAGFLQAAHLVHAARPAVRFIMAGTGVNERNEALAKLIRSAGLARQVKLLGEMRDVASLFSALDVCVSSSVSEAFSNSIGEAMSCGLPCIVTDVGESRYVVADTGRVVPPCDPRALADAMIEMVDLGCSGRALLGNGARQRIVAEFSIEAVAERHAVLYRELADGKKVVR